MDSLNKLQVIDIRPLDKNSIYVAIDSNSWKFPRKLSINDLVSNVSIDPSSLNVTIVPSKQNFFCESFIDHDVSYYRLPQNATEIGAVHAAISQNYLYIWVGNRWKRIPLSEWEPNDCNII